MLKQIIKLLYVCLYMVCIDIDAYDNKMFAGFGLVAVLGCITIVLLPDCGQNRLS